MRRQSRIGNILDHQTRTQPPNSKPDIRCNDSEIEAAANPRELFRQLGSTSMQAHDVISGGGSAPPIARPKLERSGGAIFLQGSISTNSTFWALPADHADN